MKALLLAVLLTWNFSVYSQTVQLLSQAEVDIYTCQSSIFGLQVGSALEDSDITDISKLSCLTNLYGGGLAIVNNPKLKSLQGLQNITTINGKLIIQNNDSLINLEGLPEAYTCTESTYYWRKIVIILNDNLINLNGFPKVPDLELIGIGGNLSLSTLEGLPPPQGLNNFTIGTNNLTDLSSLPVIDTIYEKLSISSKEITSLKGLENLKFCQEIKIENADALVNLDGLSGVDSLWLLSIQSCDNLQNFQGLDQLKEINKFSIEDNNKLKNFQGLSNVKKIDWLKVNSNPQLVNLQGLNDLQPIDGIEINNCPLLTSIDQLDVLAGYLTIQNCNNLSHINKTHAIGNITIKNNKKLINYGPFSEVATFNAKRIEITNNDSLVTVEGLMGLERISEELSIYEDPKLQSLTGLDSLIYSGTIFFNTTSISSLLPLKKLDSVGFKLTVPDKLGAIQNLDGLENLSYVKYGVRIFNEHLKDISALTLNPTYSGFTFSIHDCDSLPPSLHIANILADGSIKIYNNPSIESIKGFLSIDSLHRGLKLQNNVNLKEIIGLSNLTYINVSDPSSSISSNPSLTDISGLCNLFTNGTIGDLTIHDNAGFNSIQEIKDWCLTPTDDLLTYDAINIYPNPATAELFVDVPMELVQIGMMVDLLDITGVSHFSARLKSNVSRIPVNVMAPGLYFLRIVYDGRLVEVRKIVVE